MIHRSLLIAAVSVWVLAPAQRADACEFNAQRPSSKPYWDTDLVSVKVLTTGNDRVGNLDGVTTEEVIWATRLAVSAWNEDGGMSMLRLRYDGETSRVVHNEPTVVIIGDSDRDAPNGAQIANFSGTPSAFYLGTGDEEFFRMGLVSLYQWRSDGSRGAWTTTELFTTVLHELGHAMGRSHTEDWNVSDCPTGSPGSNGRASTMESGGGYYEIPRLDKHWQQKVNGTRTGGVELRFRTREGPLLSPERTQVVGTERLLYRLGSSSQNYLWHGIAWPEGPLWEPLAPGSNVLQVIGTLRDSAVKLLFLADFFDHAYTFDEVDETYSSSSPHAVAISTHTSDAILVFTSNETFQSAEKHICYRLSTNNGVSFSDTVTCLRHPDYGTLSVTYASAGVTYDPESESFLVAWPDKTAAIRIATIPIADGTVAKIDVRLGLKTNDAPSIACRRATNVGSGNRNCLVAYKVYRDGMPPCLRWFDLFVDPLDGVPNTGNEISTQCILQFDTPSIIWHESEQRYYLAFHQDNEHIWLYSKEVSAFRWKAQAVPALGRFISAPSLSTEFGGFFPGTGQGGRLAIWYLDYRP